MKKIIYLIGSEVLLNGDEQSLKFIETQAVEKEVARENVDGLELVFKDTKLVKKYQWMYGERDELSLEESEAYMELKFDPIPHQIYIIEKSETTSESYLGGRIPMGFIIPKFNKKPSFQFLGTLSNATKGLEWLPFDLLLAVPLFGHVDPLFLDYSDPLSPKVLNEDTYLNSDYEDEIVKHDTEIFYKKTFIKTDQTHEIPEFGENLGIIGVPTWIQYPAIPACPKSGKTMKFICQLNSGIDIPLEFTSLVFDEKLNSRRHILNLNFYIDGDLFLFIEPESKVVCVIIQHT